VFGVLLAAGLVSVGLAVLQWLGMGDLGHMAATRPGDRPYANLAQPNHLASLLALALVASLWFYETRRIGGAVLCAAAICLTIGMVLTRSRMVWVAAVAFVVAWVLLRQYKSTRLDSMTALGWLLFFSACTFGLEATAGRRGTASHLGHCRGWTPAVALARLRMGAGVACGLGGCSAPLHR
jgi:hypothetical protein